MWSDKHFGMHVYLSGMCGHVLMKLVMVTHCYKVHMTLIKVMGSNSEFKVTDNVFRKCTFPAEGCRMGDRHGRTPSSCLIIILPAKCRLCGCGSLLVPLLYCTV